MPSETARGALVANTLKSLRVLVVEDDPATAATLSIFLRLNGHEVSTASNVTAALQALEANNPDVVILDMGLPRIEDGLEVARQIKCRQAARHPLLVAVTGFNDNADQLRSVGAGVDLYLVKPADPKKLLDFFARYNQEGIANN